MSHDGSSTFSFSLFFHLCGSAFGVRRGEREILANLFFFVRVSDG